MPFGAAAQRYRGMNRQSDRLATAERHSARELLFSLERAPTRSRVVACGNGCWGAVAHCAFGHVGAPDGAGWLPLRRCKFPQGPGVPFTPTLRGPFVLA
jgi:hypothetical protein